MNILKRIMTDEHGGILTDSNGKPVKILDVIDIVGKHRFLEGVKVGVGVCVVVVLAVFGLGKPSKK